MRVGLMFPPDADPVLVPDFARRAEEQGFDFFCCGEHVFFHGPITNAFVALAAAAGATERIRLLSALTVLPVYPAALAAKLIATLDRVSQGRFELGVGVGGEYPPEFAAVGVPLAERGARADEALDLLSRLFTGEPVTFHGRFSTIEDQVLRPVPLQRPGPPVWVGGRKGPAIRRAARHADVWLPYLVTPDRLAAGLTEVRDLAEQYGRPRDAVRGGVFCWSVVDSDGAWARQAAIDGISATYQQDFTRFADSYLLCGNVEQVSERIMEYAAAGAQELVFAPACAEADRERVINTFVAEVLPVVRTADRRSSGGVSVVR
ncbi:MAG TPA: LLM class flavin-dependent oxidoreductase [Pseudonocardiaceae bacterium]|jgi:probable F420-dependent oxidoreductase|nr:LLM class flavin-dependent oxidoreductase [Pseudonocardiaceae bacterium]